MYESLYALHEVWLRLIKDGLVKNTDSELFANLGAYFLDNKMDPVYDAALSFIFPPTKEY